MVDRCRISLGVTAIEYCRMIALGGIIGFTSGLTTFEDSQFSIQSPNRTLFGTSTNATRANTCELSFLCTINTPTTTT